MTPSRTAWTLFGLVAGSLAILAGVAFACTNLATLNLSQATGKPGDALTVTGSSFAVAQEGSTSPVALHWNAVDGPVLAEAVPDAAGNISAAVTVPDGQPGFYVLVATQRNAEGEDEYGTPARASFQILGAGGQPLAPQAPSEIPLAPAAESSSAGMIALTAGLGVLGMVLFAAGFVAFVRQSRARGVPATAPVQHG